MPLTSLYAIVPVYNFEPRLLSVSVGRTVELDIRSCLSGWQSCFGGVCYNVCANVVQSVLNCHFVRNPNTLGHGPPVTHLYIQAQELWSGT